MKNMISVAQVISVMKALGYRVYDNPNGHDLNIVGIRTGDKAPNSFGDLMVVFHWRGSQLCYWCAPCTTEPGRFFLEHPMNDKGCGIVKGGQYKRAYSIGLHQGKYEALVQTGPITVIRDNNLDAKIDYDSPVEESGLFGGNIHHAAAKGESSRVDKWSGMCQVLANWWDFEVFMALCRAGANSFGNSFTYTLIHDKNFGLLI